jgi:hypothetical protein
MGGAPEEKSCRRLANDTGQFHSGSARAGKQRILDRVGAPDGNRRAAKTVFPVDMNPCFVMELHASVPLAIDRRFRAKLIRFFREEIV